MQVLALRRGCTFRFILLCGSSSYNPNLSEDFISRCCEAMFTGRTTGSRVPKAASSRTTGCTRDYRNPFCRLLPFEGPCTDRATDNIPRNIYLHVLEVPSCHSARGDAAERPRKAIAPRIRGVGTHPHDMRSNIVIKSTSQTTAPTVVMALI